jgi:hypothetical protein
MTLTKKEKLVRWMVAITLIMLVFVPSQIPIAWAKNIFIIIVGASSIFIQLLLLKQTTDLAHKKQSIVLVVLTLALAITSWLL